MSGFTLPELLITVAIASGLALFGTNIVVDLQKNLILETQTREIASNLSLMQAHSRTGYLLPGEAAADFDADGLPAYGLKTGSTTYELYRLRQKTADSSPQTEVIDTVTLNSSLELTSGIDILFDRVTGAAPATSLDLLRQDGQGGRRLTVSTTGAMEIQRI
jgi:prepilin-type N-terminal cleavage/methylation domain-containing protein